MDLFEKAKDRAAKPKPTAHGKKKSESAIPLPGLLNYTVVDGIEKALKGLKEGLRATIDSLMIDHFIESGRTVGKRPNNYKAAEDGASASIELRRRSSRRPLSPEEVALFDSHGISHETVTLDEGGFYINPEYIDDQVMLSRVSRALEKLGLPADFILFREKRSAEVVADESLDQIFQDDVPADLLIRIAGMLAVKPKLEEMDINQALDHLKKILDVKTVQNKDRRGVPAANLFDALKTPRKPTSPGRKKS